MFPSAPPSGLNRKKKKKINSENARTNWLSTSFGWECPEIDGRKRRTVWSVRSVEGEFKKAHSHTSAQTLVFKWVSVVKRIRHDTITSVVPCVEEERDISGNLHTHTHILTSHQQTYQTSRPACARVDFIVALWTSNAFIFLQCQCRCQSISSQWHNGMCRQERVIIIIIMVLFRFRYQ